MHTNLFFKGSWGAQVLVGFSLFACSFFVEYSVMVHFVSPPAIALLITVALEGGKVTAIVWHHYLNYLTEESYPATIRLTSLVFRFGLLFLSLICSMLFFTSHLDRPNLATVKEQELTRVKEQIAAQEDLVQKQIKEKREHLLAAQQKKVEEIRSLYDGKISKLESMMVAEMDNVVNGVFKGDRYNEFQRRLSEAVQSRDKLIADLQQQQRDELAAFNASNDSLLLSFQDDKVKVINDVINDDFSSNEAAQDKRVVALLKTLKSMVNLTILPLQFVFIFSILISLLMEIGIMLSFSTITVAIAPLLRAWHMEELEKESYRVRAESDAQKEQIKHKAAMDQIKKRGSQVVDKAKAVYRNTLAKQPVEG